MSHERAETTWLVAGLRGVGRVVVAAGAILLGLACAGAWPSHPWLSCSLKVPSTPERESHFAPGPNPPRSKSAVLMVLRKREITNANNRFHAETNLTMKA